MYAKKPQFGRKDETIIYPNYRTNPEERPIPIPDREKENERKVTERKEGLDILSASVAKRRKLNDLYDHVTSYVKHNHKGLHKNFYDDLHKIAKYYKAERNEDYLIKKKLEAIFKIFMTKLKFFCNDE